MLMTPRTCLQRDKRVFRCHAWYCGLAETERTQHKRKEVWQRHVVVAVPQRSRNKRSIKTASQMPVSKLIGVPGLLQDAVVITRCCRIASAGLETLPRS